MPYGKIARRGLIALAIIFIAGNAIAQSEQPKTYRHHKAQTDQRGTKNNPLAVDIIATEKSKADTEQEQADRDAKESNDKWAFGIGIVQCIIFFLQLLAFGCQALWMYFTVKEMKIGTQAAVDAAKAANDSAGWTRDLAYSNSQSANAAVASADAVARSANAMIAIDRAYVFVNEKIFRCSRTNGKMVGGNARVIINFVNYGKTPARISVVNTDVMIIEKIPDVPDYKTDRIIKDDEFVLKYDGVSKSYNHLIELTSEDCAAMEVYEKTVFFFGYIIYDDVFGKEWIRGFGYSYEAAVTESFRIAGGRAYNYYKRYEEGS